MIANNAKELLVEDPCKSCEENATAMSSHIRRLIGSWDFKEARHKTYPIGPEDGKPYVPLNMLPAPTPLVGPWVKPSYCGPYPDPPEYQRPDTEFPKGIPPNLIDKKKRTILQ